MGLDDRSPRNLATTPSIPLQDLSRPPDGHQDDEGWGPRGNGGRARALLGNRQAFSRRVNTAGRYERVLAGPPLEPGNRLDVPHITTPRSAHQPATFYDDGELSPVNVGEFQAAMGSVGLSFDSPAPPRPPLLTTTTASGQTHIGVYEDDTPISTPPHPTEQPTDENDDYFPTIDDDTSPLTDQRYLQPISGSPISHLSGQRHDRVSLRSAASFSGQRLGDDLPNADHNLLTPGSGRSLHRISSLSARSLTRSLSASTAASPLNTAGTIIRKMSQRVVNLSNDFDAVEPPLRRQPSTKLATLEGPPSFPVMMDYDHEAHLKTPAPEKVPQSSSGQAEDKWRPAPNPLKGNSLGLFGPENRLRKILCEIIVHPFAEPTLLILIVVQTILLAIDAAPSLPYDKRDRSWGSSWIDRAQLVLFVMYTIEIMARIIVSGFVKNADEYSSISQGLGFRRAFFAKARVLFAPHRQSTTKILAATNPADAQLSILRSFTSMQPQPGHPRQAQRLRLARRAFLRHSFNRLDFLAVMSYWIYFVLALSGVESGKHIHIFQMLSCLRILRLLLLTSGTSVILRSLKKAAPLLVNVAFLIGFFWLLFAIVGVQAFKASFRRTCVWFGDDITNIGSPDFDLKTINSYAQNTAPANIQFCGGHLNASTGVEEPYVLANLTTQGSPSHKGYLCPRRSLCVEGDNPYNGTVSFDNVLQSLQLVFVIMSSNTFSELLYYTTDSDYMAAALFFAVGIVVMSLWLMNLLVAVITSSFQVIREESKTSAFATEEQTVMLDEEDAPPEDKSPLKRAFQKTHWLWIAVIVFGLIVQCLRRADSDQQKRNFMDRTELVITLVLLAEIIARFATDWKNFHRSKRNWADLVIAIITNIIQLPPIRNSGQPYAWLTFFQIVRVYRVVLAIPLTRQLIELVFTNISGIVNLILFVFLITFLVAIFAVQIFRGEFPDVDTNNEIIRVTFSDIYNSFIGMYQVLSSENWTTLMYNATQYEFRWATSWIAAAFFLLWFTLANFIILSMFIAVIQESFDVSEDEKRLQQVKAFLQQRELVGSTHSTLSLSTIFRFGRDKARRRDPLEYGPATIEMVKDTVVRDFLNEQMEGMDDADQNADSQGAPASGEGHTWLLRLWDIILSWVWRREPNPFYSRLTFSRPYEDLDPRTMAREIETATQQRKLAQRRYLQNHPHFNVSLFLFQPSHPLRRFCQRIVGPGRGTSRIDGVEPARSVWYAFSFFIYANVVTMVTIACVATPLYMKEYYDFHGRNVRNWFTWSDVAFASIFSIEALIKIVADGFYWTPNAYFRGTWGVIDGIVLITLWINVVTSLYDVGGISRAVGAFKALRALRLLNVSDNAKSTFHSVIIMGGWKVLSAAFVSLSLLIPFAIYGLNLFHGRMEQCNDTGSNIVNLSDCTGEYQSTPYNWQVLAPRQVANPYYNFDDFGNSLFILFQIVSQEGWVDVMWQAMSSVGPGLQVQPNAANGNSVYFIIFNLLGSVFVLTLFVSVFMRNYTEQTGVAFLTAEQRSWLELRKLLRQISPSKRPTNRPNHPWKTWCYRIAVKKHGRWQRTVTAVLILHLILLVLEYYPETPWWVYTRDYMFLAFTGVYVANIVIRIVGLTWRRFRRSSWDLWSILSVTGTIITSLLDLSTKGKGEPNRAYTQLHRLFLVSISLLLIPRNNQLDQLFKTAAASLTAIGNLLATWFVIFLVFAIAMTQTLGLTRFGPQARANLNFRSVPKALILLFRMSCGEGWNQIMEEYATITPPYCVSTADFFKSDCGSPAWARILFILWNIISMYIFVSMFVSLIFESFSYVYQRSSGLSVVSREEIRRFKQAWATFDPDGTGFISKEALPRLLGELSGVFEMRIYDGEHTVNCILEDCRVDTRGMDPPPPGVVHGIDLARLNKRLDTINVPEIRRRRERIELFSQEMMVTADPDRGIPFNSCLMILAHYNVISDHQSLRLEEFLRRRHRLQLVQEEVRRRVVMRFFDTVYYSRLFRRRQDLRNSARMVTIPQFAVPEIFVDDQDGQDGPSPLIDSFPPTTPRSISPTNTGSGHSRAKSAFGLGIGSSPPRSSSMRDRGDSFGSSPSRSEYSFNPSPARGARRPSDLDLRPDPLFSDGNSNLTPGSRSRAGTVVSASSIDPESSGHRRQQSSIGSTSQQLSALQVFDNSAWGESIRRSFTVRRNGTRARRMGSQGHGRV